MHDIYVLYINVYCWQTICLRREKVSFVKARINYQCCKIPNKWDFPNKNAILLSLFYKFDKMCFYLVWVKTYVLSLYVTIFNVSFCLTSQLEFHNETGT